jgi:hypothetical protein
MIGHCLRPIVRSCSGVGGGIQPDIQAETKGSVFG